MADTNTRSPSSSPLIEIGCKENFLLSNNQFIKLRKIVFASISVNGLVHLLLVVAVIALGLTLNAKLQQPLPNQVQFRIQNGDFEKYRTVPGEFLTGWETLASNMSGNDMIATVTDDGYAIVIEKECWFDIIIQVVFKNKAPHNYLNVLIDGVEWRSVPHSSPLQLDDRGEVQESYVPLTLSGRVYLRVGNRLSINLGHSERRISVKTKHTFVDLAERC